MRQIDYEELWLSSVSRAHSNSSCTRSNYKRKFQEFLTYAETSAAEIIADYDAMDEKAFKLKWTPLINSFINSKEKEGYAPNSLLSYLSAVKSFFKYNSLPLNYTPTVNPIVIFHNRDILKEEIEDIIRDSQPREKAFYALMVQSGLRPNEICNLKVEDFEKLAEDNTPIPCMITIRQEATKGKYSSYFSFAGKESIDYLKDYFKRENKKVTPESYVFTKDDGESKTDTDLISHLFRRTVNRLKKQNKLDFKNKQSDTANRNELRLYNLRKYFRMQAGQAGPDYVNFWMGHTNGVDDHYFSGTDTKKHRKQYSEKAMPNLRIEERTPNEKEETISKLEVENKELKKKLTDVEHKLNVLGTNVKENIYQVLEELTKKQAIEYFSEYGDEKIARTLTLDTLMKAYAEKRGLLIKDELTEMRELTKRNEEALAQMNELAKKFLKEKE